MSNNMKRSMNMLKQTFESSSVETQQFRTFYFAFKSDLTRVLKPYISKIQFNKGHFFISGFFTMNDGRIYYFSLSDVRWFKDSMMIRTATSYKDFTGGVNNQIRLDDSFEERLLSFLRV